MIMNYLIILYRKCLTFQSYNKLSSLFIIYVRDTENRNTVLTDDDNDGYAHYDNVLVIICWTKFLWGMHIFPSDRRTATEQIKMNID